MRPAAFTILLSTTLAACGGTSSDRSPTLAGYSEDAGDIADDFAAAGYGLTPTGAIPTGGTATYSGVAEFGSAREDYAGRMTVSADFDAPFGSAFSGGVDRIVDSRDRDVDGRLDITFGEIDRAADPVFDDQILIDLDGNLVDAGGVVIAVSARADGVFRGPSAEGIAGTIDGDMLSGAYGSETITGAYIAAE